MADNLTYQTPDTPTPYTDLIVPAMPQLEPLTEFVSNPEQFIAKRPMLQPNFQAPLKQEGDKRNKLNSILNQVVKDVNNLPYNKYDTKQIAYDNKQARLYDDPETGFVPGRDNESYYDANQTWLGDVGRNFLGFSANVIGTALNVIPSTISGIGATVSWLASGFDSEAFSKAYDNPIGQKLNDWMLDVQDRTRNYSSVQERELEERNPLLNIIPFYGRGFGDAMRSLGYGIGSAVGLFAEEALITALTGGTGTIPSLAAKLGRFVRIGNKVDNVAAVARNIDNIAEVAEATYRLGRNNGIANKTINASRAVLSSLSEASFEATETQKNLEWELIDQYRKTNGVDPSEQDLMNIRKYTIEAANARYIANVGVLTLSNAVQFDALFKTFPMAKYFRNESARAAVELGDTGLKLGSKTNILSSAEPWYRKLKNAAVGFSKSNVRIAPMEGVEEGLQNAIDVGTGYYAEQKFKGKGETLSVLDAVGKGLQQTISTSQGWNSIIQGMVAGGIQSTASNVLTSGARADANRARDIQQQAILDGVNSLITTNGQTDYAKVRNLFNVNSIGGTLQNKLDTTSGLIGSQKDAKVAVENGDQESFQTKKDDIQFGFISSFVAHNQSEALDDILQSWRNLSNQDFDAFKTQFGLDAPTTSKADVDTALNRLKAKADDLKTKYDRINLAFVNPHKSKTIEYDRYNRYKQEMVYQLFQYERYNERYNELKKNNIAGSFEHLLDFFKGRKAIRESIQERTRTLRLEDEQTQPQAGDIGVPELKAENAKVQESIDALEKLKEANFENISEEDARNIMLLADKSFGRDELRSVLNIDDTLNTLADMVALQNNANEAMDRYRKLTDRKNGENLFTETENNIAEKYENQANVVQEQTRREEEKRQQEQQAVEKRNAVQTNFGEQLEELSTVTGTPLDVLADELVQRGEVTPEKVDEFVENKLSGRVNVPSLRTVQVDLEGLDVSGLRNVLNQLKNKQKKANDSDGVDLNSGARQADIQDVENLIKDRLEEFKQSQAVEAQVERDKLNEYRNDPKKLVGNFITFISGSENGTKQPRFVDSVGETTVNQKGERVTELTTTYINEEGKFITERKKFGLDTEKFVSVQTEAELADLANEIRNRREKPPVPPSQPNNQPSDKGRSSLVFNQFFIPRKNQTEGFEIAERITRLDTGFEPRIRISRYTPRNKPSLNKFKGEGIDNFKPTFQGNGWFVNSTPSPNTFGVSMEDAGGNMLGLFLPISSYDVIKQSDLDKNKDTRTSLYALVDDYYRTKSPQSLKILKTVTDGSIDNLLLTYHLENIFRNRAQNLEGLQNVDVSVESINQDLKALGVDPIIFKPFYRGTNSKRNQNLAEDSFPFLRDMRFDRTKAFVYVDNEGAKFFEGTTLTQDDVDEMRRTRKELFDSDGNSRLSSYVLFTKDSANMWTALPVRTVPVTNTNPEIVQKKQDTEDRIRAKALQDFPQMTAEQQMQFLNNELFYQDASLVGHFNVSSNGRLEFYTRSLFKEAITRGGNGRNDEQKITTYLDDQAGGINYNFTNFTFEDFAKAIDDNVKRKSTVVKVDVGNFRFKERFGKQTADEFSDFRVLAENELPFVTVNVSYTTTKSNTSKSATSSNKNVEAVEEVRKKAKRATKNKKIENKPEMDQNQLDFLVEKSMRECK